MNTLRVKLVLGIVVGLGAGGAVGVMFARRTIGMGHGSMSQWAAVGTYSQLADFQYQYADKSHARAALSDFLSFAEKLEATGNVTDPKALQVSVARTYVRLAVLDREVGDTNGYQSDLSRAQEALKAAGSPHASIEDVRRSVDQLDSARVGTLGDL
ncbi:MAG: hypothetical protein WCD68_07090 [Candidatus Acidiferrum sp.]